jgi:hypothetical protein
MAKKQKADPAAASPEAGSQSSKRAAKAMNELGDSVTNVVLQAATLLDEELAAGIVAAKQVQKRFRETRRIDPADFRQALEKFQSDGHELIGMLGERMMEPRSEESKELIERFVGHAQSMLDVMVEMVNTSAELANEFIPKRKSDEGAAHGKSTGR